MKKRKPIRTISSRQRIIKECDKLLFEILKKKRGNKCQICGRPKATPSHILDKGRYPRLRFAETNVLLMCWMPCHYALHHYTHHHPRYKRTIQGIKRILGSNYYDRLLILNKGMPSLSTFQLELIRTALKQELGEI